MAAVRARLADSWQPCANVAEELALHLVISRAVVELKLAAAEDDGILTPELKAAFDAVDLFRDMVFEDVDFVMLYDPSIDGFTPEDFGAFGRSMAPMDFTSWFTPFNHGRAVDY